MATVTKEKLLDDIRWKLHAYPDEFVIKSNHELLHISGITISRPGASFSWTKYDEKRYNDCGMSIDAVYYHMVGEELWNAWNACHIYLEEKAELKALNKTVRRLYNIKWWQK